jgi:two-component system, NtrC family, response regulator AtoC
MTSMRTDSHTTVILLGEGEPEMRQYLEMVLSCDGYAIELAQDGEEVLRYIREGHPVSALVLDMVLPRKDGIETLREIRSVDPDLPVIVIAGAFSSGVTERLADDATEVLSQPVSPDDLRRAVRKALDRTAERNRNSRITLASGNQALFGSSPQMKQLQALVRRVGESDAPVLIQGETGVGKEVLARQLHALSPRSNKSLLKLNCAALPSELVESELFGYERGAFTGAFQKKPGMFEMADGGTILLDEIGDMEFKLQAKLLQVLQDLQFQRLGGRECVKVDVRIIAATHNDLESAIAAGRFREDLYYRLNVINLYVPSLRDRKEEVPALFSFFVQKYATDGRPAPRMTPALEAAMAQHNWPGNVRELENFVRAWLVLGDSEAMIRRLYDRMGGSPQPIPRPQPVLMPAMHAPAPLAPQRLAAEGHEPVRESNLKTMEQVTKAKQADEAEAILAALNATQWNRRQAAELLRIDYKALLYKLKKPGIREKLAASSNPRGAAAHANQGYLAMGAAGAAWAAGS